MGIGYEIDVDARIVRLNYVGETTADEFVATMTAILRSPQYRRGFGFLSDRRGANAATTPYVQGALAFARAQREHLAGVRWATVASGPVNFGLGRMAQALVEIADFPVAFQVFRDLDQAEAWLRKTDPG
jgi:hypothetical protein